VRIVTQSGHLLDWAHRDRAPRLFRGDGHATPRYRPRTMARMRVRATPHGTSGSIGTVARITADTIVWRKARARAAHFAISALDGLA